MTEITSAHKGFAPTLVGRTVAEVAGRSLVDTGFTFPLMVLTEAALEHNIAAMADYCERAGVLLAPHGKSTMSPELHARQLAAGAWAITAATIHQAAVYRRHGVRRVLLANQLVDRAAIAWVMRELEADPGFDFLCLVDSIDGVALLAEAIGTAPTRPLPVLVEVGYPGGRAGCRDVESVLAVARQVRAEPRLSLAGLSGFEGLLGHDSEPHTFAAVNDYLDRLGAAVRAVQAVGLIEGIALVSCGASSFFDRVVDTLAAPDIQLVLRCGSYITHDHGLYVDASPFDRSGPPLRPAITVWAQVLSLPEPDLAIIGGGKRDLPVDCDLPVPLWWWPREGTEPRVLPGHHTVDLNDHHLYLRRDESGLGVGDLVGFGISHPCTAFDKWRLIPLVDDDWTVLGAVHTCF